MKAERHQRNPSRGKGPHRGGPKKGRKAHGKPNLQAKKLRQQQGGSLPKRPDIKGLDGEGLRKKHKKPTKAPHPKKQQPSKVKEDGCPRSRIISKQRHRPQAGGKKAADAAEQPRKRKLMNGQERLRALLEKHPDLLCPGESADAAVAACFKNAGKLPEGSSDGAATSGTDCETRADPGAEPQQAQLSGSKRRKLMRLVMSSKTADDKVFVHQSYQLYNDILGSIRKAEAPGASAASLQSRKALQNAVAKAIGFLEGPLARKDRHCCTARLAQMCLKHSEGEKRDHLWELLYTDFLEFCSCKAFHHVAMKMFLYGSEAQRGRLTSRLASRKEAALTKHGAAVWEYFYTSQRNALGQQKLLNSLLLEPALLVAVPKVNEASSFSQVIALLSETQRAKTFENLSTLIQKFVDKELLNKAHVHRILKGFCSVADDEELAATWRTVAEGALHLATTKDGVEALCRLVGFASAKERKAAIKGLKQHCLAFACNAVDCPLLLRFLLTVDDTKLLSDQVLKEVLPASLELSFDPCGHLVLLQLLQREGICRQLPTHYQTLLSLPSPYSLKPAAQRQAELLPAVVSALSEAFAALALRASDKSERTVAAALKDSHAAKVFLQLSQHPDAEKASLRALAALKEDLQQEEPTLVSDPTAQRALSGLVKAGGAAVVEGAWEALDSNLPAALRTRGVFVVLQAFKTAGELKLTDLETKMRQRLDAKTLDNAEAALCKSGSQTTGIQLLRKELAP
ncbi:hypothetical protein cyc_00688 [Cyclospora cayetanensis]|uniref:Uncharacterized protein n=1 Tax=Cyclospora cayetanensis TaxID=88456 RepID=A0A1D3CR90_9EIME|nr:hypothetical protein cyc_00688 [Cyclospora cayetanensis]